MLPYSMHIPLALQRGSCLASVLRQLLRTLPESFHTGEQAEEPRDAFKTCRKAGEQGQSCWHCRLEGWSQEHLQALGCLAGRHLHKFKKPFWEIKPICSQLQQFVLVSKPLEVQNVFPQTAWLYLGHQCSSFYLQWQAEN